jgi:hypothetical protein
MQISNLILTIYGDALVWLEQHLLACPSKKWLHMDCPGCGMQRSLLALLKGNVMESLAFYPATIPVLLMLLYLALHLYFKFSNGAKILTFFFIVNTSIIVLNYIYKITTHQTF